MSTRKHVVELIGTFFLVLTIGQCVIQGGSGVIPPLAIGSILMVMVYAGGHVSGAHYNPAVTLAVFLRGRCPAKDILPYMAAQVFGASIASGLVLYLKGDYTLPSGATPDSIKSFLVELLFTFGLVYVILNVATSKATAGNSYYGLAIGFTVMAGAFAVGPISGGAFNPAVAIGLTIMGLAKVGHMAVLILATFAGGAIAAYTFRYINPDDR